MAGFGGEAEGVLDVVGEVEVASHEATPTARRVLAGPSGKVIELEPAEVGDEGGGCRTKKEESSLWWRSLARMNGSLRIDIRPEVGHNLLLNLAPRTHVSLDGSCPNALERLAFGQYRLHRYRVALGSVAEATDTLRRSFGPANRARPRAVRNLRGKAVRSCSTTGCLLALRARHRPLKNRLVVREGRCHEVADVGEFGVVCQRTVMSVQGVARSNTYRCAHAQYADSGVTGHAMLTRTAVTIGQTLLPSEPHFTDAPARVTNAKTRRTLTGNWIADQWLQDATKALRTGGGPSRERNDASDDTRNAACEAPPVLERQVDAVRWGEERVNGLPAAAPKPGYHSTSSRSAHRNPTKCDEALGLPTGQPRKSPSALICAIRATGPRPASDKRSASVSATWILPWASSAGARSPPWHPGPARQRILWAPARGAVHRRGSTSMGSWLLVAVAKLVGKHPQIQVGRMAQALKRMDIGSS